MAGGDNSDYSDKKTNFQVHEGDVINICINSLSLLSLHDECVHRILDSYNLNCHLKRENIK